MHNITITNLSEIKVYVNAILNSLPGYQSIFKDASKSEYGTGGAIVIARNNMYFLLPDSASVHTAESFVINKVLTSINKSAEHNLIIISKSVNSIISFQQVYTNTFFIQHIKKEFIIVK